MPERPLPPRLGSLRITRNQRESWAACAQAMTPILRFCPPWYQGLPPYSRMEVTSDGRDVRILVHHVSSPEKVGCAIYQVELATQESRSTLASGDCRAFPSERLRSPDNAKVYLGQPNAGFPECMVRRRVASGKMSLAVGLRQCIRPLVESVTPGLDGHPLAFAPINWTVS